MNTNLQFFLSSESNRSKPCSGVHIRSLLRLHAHAFGRNFKSEKEINFLITFN